MDRSVYHFKARRVDTVAGVVGGGVEDGARRAHQAGVRCSNIIL